MKIFDPHITGSLSVSASAEIQGDLIVSGTIFGTAQISGQVQDAVSASHASSYLLTSSFENYTGSVATTGSNVFKGDQTISGSLLPEGTLTHDIGSDGQRWRDIYLAGNTINLGGTTITKNDDGDVELKDSSNNLKKIIASEIEIGTGNGKKVLKVSNGRLKLMDTLGTDDEAAALSGSFTGSFVGDGSKLTNVPASAVQGLSLNRIADGAVTASIGNGKMTLNANFEPDLTDTRDLGSPTKQWRDLFLSSGSLYINGQQVISTTGNELRITTDDGESIKILETGSDTITLQTENGDITLTSSGNGNIELDAPIQIGAGKKILSSDGNSIQFGNGLIVTGSIVLSGTVDGVDVADLKSDVDAILAGSSADKDSFAEIVQLINSVDTTNDQAFASHYTASNNRLDSLELISSSHDGRLDNIESFTSSIDTTIKSKLNTENVVSGSEFILNSTSPITQYVDVTVTQSGGLYYIDGIRQQILSLSRGLIYRFDVSDSSLSGHPFRFSTDDQHQNQHTNGVTVSGTEGTSGAYVQIIVDHSTPQSLYYYCTNHNGMGNKVFVGGAGDTDSVSEGLTNLYYTDARVKTKLNTEDVVSGSIQIVLTGTTGYGTLNTRIGSIESFTASIDDTYATDEDVTNLRDTLNSYTSSTDGRQSTQDGRLNSLELKTGSLTNDISGLDGRLDSIELKTGSLDSTNTVQNGRLDSLETKTGSLVGDISTLDGRVDSLEIESGSIRTDFNSYTTSNDLSFNIVQLSVSSLETESGSIRTDFNTHTSSANSRLGSLESFTASIDDTFATDGDVTNLRNDLNAYTSSNDGRGTVQDGRLNSLETESGSIRTDFNNVTSSFGGRLNSLETESGSIRTTFNSYTSSNNTTNTTQNNRLTSLETESGSIRSDFNIITGSFDDRLDSLESTSGSHNTRIGNLETFESKVDGGLEFTGSNVTIKGDLLVKGTETRVNSTTVEVSDNIISLNGSGAANAGIEVRDATSPGLLSGSLLWDGTNNYWKGGTKGSEERILLNSDLTTINGRIGSLETQSGSIRSDFNSYTSSNDTTNTTQNSRLTSLESATGSYTTTDYFTTGATFDNSTGVIRGTRNDGGSWSVDIDGRYLTSHPSITAASSSDNSGRTYIQDILLDSNGHVTGLTTATETVVNTDTIDYVSDVSMNGNSLRFTSVGSAFSGDVDLSQFLDNSDEYTTGATFNTSNGIITFTRNDGDTFSVDIDGRFLTSYTETDTLDSVVSRGNATARSIMLGSGTPWTPLTINASAGEGTANAGVAIAFDGTDYSEYGYRFKANGSNYYQVLYNGSSINWKHYTGGVYTTKLSLSNGGNLTATSFVKSGGTSSQFLKADGSVDTNTYLTAHPSVSAASSSDNSGRTYIQDILLDAYGHITGLTTATETVTNTDEYTTGGTLNTSSGIITFVRNDGDTYDVDISATLSDVTVTGATYDSGTQTLTMTKSDGNSFNVTGFAVDTDVNWYLTGATFNTGNGVLSLSVKDYPSSPVTVDLDGRYAYYAHQTLDNSNFNNVRASGIYTLDYGGQANENGPDGQAWHALFHARSGGTRQAQITIPYNADNIYYRRADTATGEAWNDWVRIWDTEDFTSTQVSNWDTAYSWGDHGSVGYITGYTNTYVTGATFSTSNGIITLTRNDGNTVTVDIDGKYAESGHSHNVYDLNNFISGADPNSQSQGRLWSSLNGGTQGNYPSSYNGVVNLGIDGSHGLQFSYHYGATDDALYFRHKSDNPSAPNGVGWQGWQRIASQAWVAARGYLTTYNNYYVTGATFNTGDGIITLTRNDGNTVTVDIDGKYAESGHNHDTTYLKLAGGTMTGNINFSDSDEGITWTMNTDGAYIKFINTGDGDTNSRLEYGTSDNDNEYHRWVISNTEYMNLKTGGLTVNGTVTATSLVKSGGTSAQFLMADGSTSTDPGWITGYTDTNYYVTGATLSSNTLTLTRNDATDVTVNLNALVDVTVTGGTYDDSTKTLRLNKSDGNSFDVTGFTIDTNTYITGATFGTSDGVLTLKRNSGTDVTVDLDGRYLESYSETSTLEDVIGRGNTTNGFISFTGNGTDTGIRFNNSVVANDAFGIRSNGTSNAGELEFFSTDDDNEPFVFRHYTAGQDGSGSSVEWFRIGAGGDITAARHVYASGGNSTQWNSAYTYSQVGHLPLAGGTLSGDLDFSTGHGRDKIDLNGSDAHTFGTETYHNTYGPNTWNSGTIAHKFYANANTVIATIGTGGNPGSRDSIFYGKVTLESSTSGSTIFDIQGTSGQLFSITDDLTGDLFAVSDASGVPIIKVNASGAVTMDTLSSFYVGDNKVINGSGNIVFDGPVTTTNQGRGIYWTGYDKEGVTDFSDNAHILHTTNSGGLAGSVIEIKAQNDTNDGVNFVVNGDSGVRINGNVVVHAGNYTSYQQHPTIVAASSSDNSGRTYIQDILLDSNGHVTGITTATETVVNTDTNDIDYINGASFNTSDGVLTLTGVGNAGASVDLDGRYMQINTSTEITSGVYTFRSQNVGESTGGDQATLEIYQDQAGEDAFMQFHISGDYAVYFGLDGASNDLFVGGWSMGAVKNKVYHAGNLTNLNQLSNGPGYITGNQTITLTGDASGSGTTSISVTVDKIDGVNFRNTGSNQGVNANTLDSNGMTYVTNVDGSSANLSGNSTDGALYSQVYSSSWQHQIYGDYRTGEIYVRGKNNNSWQSWKRVALSSASTFSNVTTHTFNHGLGTEYVTAQVFDTSGNMFFPSNIQITGTQVILTFATARSGRVVVTG